MILEKKNEVVYYLKYIWYLLTKRMWLPLIVLMVTGMWLVGEVIYNVSTSPTYSERNMNIEYVVYDNAAEDISSITDFNEEVDPKFVYDFEKLGYIDVNTQLNIRKEPNTDSQIIGLLNWMDEVIYSTINNDWAIILMDDGEIGYIASKYIVDDEINYSTSYKITGDKSKTYMDYRTITDKSSKQYRLQLRASTNPDNGLRMLRDRYMVAIGSYFNCSVGQYIDVILSDGEILECMIGDAKQDIHTDSENLHGLSGDTVEFIVNEDVLKEKTDVIGNISDVSEVFDDKVVEVRVYPHVEK